MTCYYYWHPKNEVWLHEKPDDLALFCAIVREQDIVFYPGTENLIDSRLISTAVKSFLEIMEVPNEGSIYVYTSTMMTWCTFASDKLSCNWPLHCTNAHVHTNWLICFKLVLEYLVCNRHVRSLCIPPDLPSIGPGTQIVDHFLQLSLKWVPRGEMVHLHFFSQWLDIIDWSAIPQYHWKLVLHIGDDTRLPAIAARPDIYDVIGKDGFRMHTKASFRTAILYGEFDLSSSPDNVSRTGDDVIHHEIYSNNPNSNRILSIQMRRLQYRQCIRIAAAFRFGRAYLGSPNNRISSDVGGIIARYILRQPPDTIRFSVHVPGPYHPTIAMFKILHRDRQTAQKLNKARKHGRE